MFNAYWDRLTFELPPAPGDPRHGWRRAIDTFLPSPHDIERWQEAAPVIETRYIVQPRSVVVLARALAGSSG
jgi:glycogen operon protein